MKPTIPRFITGRPRRASGARPHRDRLLLAAVVVAGMLLTGCDKLAAKLGLHTKSKKTAATTATTPGPAGPPAIIIASTSVNTNLTAMDLGTILLTNHLETVISLGVGTNCRVSALLLSKRSVQLTLTVEARNSQGQMQDLSITQVAVPPDEHYDANVGEFTFSFTPKIVTSE